ncbi:hypothetical protein [Myxococcus xanthus]|uniref:hypothetical protein n=1 Tax=Myxococcus xanthus TaxID=34 RepID=UPI003004FF41
MEFHKGRLFDHVHLRLQDLDASKQFYRAVLVVLGVPFFSESPHHLSADELFVDRGSSWPRMGTTSRPCSMAR